jgi:hypothetical protein
MRIIGTARELTPAEAIRQMEKLRLAMDTLRPYKKPRGKILRFKTWKELDDFNLSRAANRQ